MMSVTRPSKTDGRPLISPQASLSSHPSFLTQFYSVFFRYLQFQHIFECVLALLSPSFTPSSNFVRRPLRPHKSEEQCAAFRSFPHGTARLGSNIGKGTLPHLNLLLSLLAREKTLFSSFQAFHYYELLSTPSFLQDSQ